MIGNPQLPLFDGPRCLLIRDGCTRPALLEPAAGTTIGWRGRFSGYCARHAIRDPRHPRWTVEFARAHYSIRNGPHLHTTGVVDWRERIYRAEAFLDLLEGGMAIAAARETVHKVDVPRSFMAPGIGGRLLSPRLLERQRRQRG